MNWEPSPITINEATHLWQQVIDTKHGEEWDAWTSGSVRVPHGCSLWQSIRAGLGQFAAICVSGVGDGSHLRFGMIIGVEGKL